jgi:FkbM family methyltransferase
MRYQYFGQLGEDYLLWHFFDFKKSGFFLDIGAYDGVTISNSKSFEDQGWTGICVEPHPDYFVACQQMRRRTVHAACVSGPEQTIGLRIDCSGLFSGTKPDETHATRIYSRVGAGHPEYRMVTVPAVRAANLLLPTDPPIDFASIDVEGTEIDVLEGLDLARNRPRVLLMEANTEPERTKLDAYLSKFDYQRARSLEWNHLYATSDRDARKLRSITVNCALTIPAIRHLPLAKVSDRAWSNADTRTRFGFFVAKLRHRYRRWFWGV